MTLVEIFATYATGTTEFVQAIQRHCDFGLSDREIERIVKEVQTAKLFKIQLEEEVWWMDAIYNEEEEVKHAEEKSETLSLLKFKYPVYMFHGYHNLLKYKNKAEFGAYIEVMRKKFGIPDKTSMEQVLQCLVLANYLKQPSDGLDPNDDVYLWDELPLMKLVKG